MKHQCARRVREIDWHLGRRFRVARKAKQLSQMELAAEQGISISQARKYEKGQNRIGAARLFETAQA